MKKLNLKRWISLSVLVMGFSSQTYELKASQSSSSEQELELALIDLEIEKLAKLESQGF